MEKIGKAISLFSKCDAYLLCYVNTFWGCSRAWDAELLLTGVQAVYQRSFAACKDTIGWMCASCAKEPQGDHKNIFLRSNSH